MARIWLIQNNCVWKCFASCLRTSICACLELLLRTGVGWKSPNTSPPSRRAFAAIPVEPLANYLSNRSQGTTKQVTRRTGSQESARATGAPETSS